MEFSKQVLSKNQFIAESGYGRTYVDKCCHSEWANLFIERTSNSKKATMKINIKKFFEMQEKGYFRGY